MIDALIFHGATAVGIDQVILVQATHIVENTRDGRKRTQVSPTFYFPVVHFQKKEPTDEDVLLASWGYALSLS